VEGGVAFILGCFCSIDEIIHCFVLNAKMNLFVYFVWDKEREMSLFQMLVAEYKRI
jgi:hypothetical protein